MGLTALQGPCWSQINPEWLMSCWKPQPMRPACWCREESCSGPGAPWPARVACPSNPHSAAEVCSCSTLHLSRAAQPSRFPWIAHKTQSSTPQSKAFLASLCPPRKVPARAILLPRKNRKEDFSIHVPLCLDCLPLALPGTLPLLCLCWCLSIIIEWQRGQFLKIHQSLLIWESCLPPRPLVAIRDTRLGDECQECEC